MSNNLWGDKRRLPRFALESGQRGQAIVLIALMLVLLLGMTAIAIDGGGLLFLQRDAQNAADAGVIVGAYALCNGQEDQAGTLAIQGARENGFTNGGTNTNAEVIDVKSYCMYHTGNGGSCDGELDLNDLPVEVQDQADQFIRMEITAHKPTYFAQLVYTGPMSVTVSAVAQCEPPSGPGKVPAILGLGDCATILACPGDKSSVDYSGATSAITGGVGSNCKCDLNGSGQTAEWAGGTACTAGLIHNNGVDHVDGGDPNPDPNAPVMDDPLAEIYPLSAYQAPSGYYYLLAASDTTCTDAAGAGVGGTTTGCYHSGSASDFDGNLKATDVFEGIYYMTGDWSPGGNIYVGDNGATFITPDGVINFTKMPSPGLKPYKNAGFLLVASYKDDVCDTVIQGPNSNDNYFKGIMYGPRGQCSFSIASSVTTYGAIVCQKVDISGSNFELYFDPLMLPRKPGSTSGNQ